jgi:hypothetical protein
VTNALTYYTTVLITSVKEIVALDPGSLKINFAVSSSVGCGGATTISQTTFGLMTFDITAFRIATLSPTIFSIHLA